MVVFDCEEEEERGRGKASPFIQYQTKGRSQWRSPCIRPIDLTDQTTTEPSKQLTRVFTFDAHLTTAIQLHSLQRATAP